ncbi:class I SAM-dependent methyltransferase [Bradyrhizobium guangdongense]|uniref:class I SAM-dependent methyltransferase n=1 Tax=Bradyrhizobium guangdongense TaxID=1325090 RepID=UPI00131A186A|nr:class I SAM-dependent methyltransferase [Bradyrhizobium guangdongense]
MSSDADTIIGLYRRHATAWLHQRGRHLTERKWLERFMAQLPAKPSVLDIGCGPGEPIARYLLETGCAVTGIDAAPEMIDIARSTFPGATWHVSDMRSLDLNKTFDGLLAWNSFFHLSPADQRAMFPIFRRHAADGAALMFTSGPSFGEAIGTFEGEPLYHASLDTTEYRRLLDSTGFDVVDHAVEDPECGRLTVWIGRLRRRETT